MRYELKLGIGLFLILIIRQHLKDFICVYNQQRAIGPWEVMRVNKDRKSVSWEHILKAGDIVQLNNQQRTKVTIISPSENERLYPNSNNPIASKLGYDRGYSVSNGGEDLVTMDRLFSLRNKMGIA